MIVGGPSMKFYTIEVDEKVWNYLKKNAEPFKDTPNSVLNRIIFGKGSPPVSKISAPKASAPKIIPPPRPYEKQKPKIEIPLENDLTVDGIKLELEEQGSKENKILESTFNPTSLSESSESEDLQFELEDEFETDKKTGISFSGSIPTLKPDKDIDDFINELEKSNSSASIKDEFSNILDEISSDNGEWTEISITPKKDFDIDNQVSVTFKPESKEPDKITRPHLEQRHAKPPEKKKPMLVSFEDKLIYSLGERLKNQWGDFRQEGVGLLIFANKTVLCKFSKYDEKNAKWFWGVSQADRYAWSPQNWLALIFENEDHNTYSFLLFNSQESGVLFDQCKQATGDKYISMLTDDAYESLRIQEWRHLDLRNRKKALPLYNPNDE
jgi:hypothetical protein